MSALQAISRQHTSSPLILDILLLHSDLYNRNFDSIFWIPSHVIVGIVVNTKVDLLPRTPSLSPIPNINVQNRSLYAS